MKTVHALIAVALIATSWAAQAADNWELGRTQYNAICVNCHNANVTLAAGAGGAYPPVSPAGASALFLQGKIDGGMGSPYTTSLRTADASINNTVSDIAAYIGNPQFPTATPQGLGSPAQYNFGSTIIDTTAETTIEIRNNGNENLDATVSIAGSGAAAYSRSPATCTAIIPGGSCFITVTFLPIAVIGYAATLSISDSDLLGGKTDVGLSGSGGNVPPKLKVLRDGIELTTADDLRLQFGTQAIGGLYDPITLTLENAGTVEALDVALPALASTPGFEFAAVNEACAVLQALGQCGLTVSFKPPPVVQPYSAMLILGSRPAGSAAAYESVALELLGTASASQVPSLRWTREIGPDPSPITADALPDTAVGTSSGPQVVRLFNAGPGNVVLSLLNVIGPDRAAFAIDAADCKAAQIVREGESCALTLHFAPTTSGSKTAAVQATAGGGSDAPIIVAPRLAVSAQANSADPPPALIVSALQIDFGSQVVGSESDVRTLRLQNSPSAALPVVVQSVVGSGPFTVRAGSCGNLPMVLPPGAECTLSLVFTPQSDGNATGTLQIGYDSVGVPLEVALTGDGQARADLSSGGCSIANGESPADPTLWLLLLLAALALICRGRHARV